MPFETEITQEQEDKLLLQRARDRCDRRWCQYPGRDEEGGVCLSYAIRDALVEHGYDPWKDDALAMRRLLLVRLMGFKNATEAIHWNDELGRTRTDVLARFDEAIERL